MSFDLYFCWRNPHRINFGEVEAWAKEDGCFTRNNAQLWYSNPKTGVYFGVDFEAEAQESPEDGPDIPDGYFDSGLSFNLNYNRPTYFGLESMPVVERLASKFGLSVVNPQEDFDASESALAADSEILTRSWVRHNQQAILVMIEQPNSSRPVSMSTAASIYLWRYAMGQEDLERTCGEGIFVPRLAPVQRKGHTEAGRVIAYTEGLPTVIPECEWVFIVRRKKGLIRSKKQNEVVAISAATFRETLANCIRPFHWEGPDLQIISSELAGKAGKITRAIERTLPRSEFEVLGADSFVDIDLPSAIVACP